MSREKLEACEGTRAYTKGRGPRGLRDTVAGLPRETETRPAGHAPAGQLRALRCGRGHPCHPVGSSGSREGVLLVYGWLVPVPAPLAAPDPVWAPGGPDEASGRARPGLGSHRARV